MKREIADLPASVTQRLLNLRDPRKEDFQLILNRYGLERFLYRLSQGPFSDQLILKGAFSFELWGKQFYRPTRDVDFLAVNNISLEETRRIFMTYFSYLATLHSRDVTWSAASGSYSRMTVSRSLPTFPWPYRTISAGSPKNKCFGGGFWRG